MYSFRGTVHNWDEPADQFCPTQRRNQGSLPSSRGFMNDLTLTTTTCVQTRWMLTALTDVASWERMKFKAVTYRPLQIDNSKALSLKPRNQGSNGARHQKRRYGNNLMRTWTISSKHPCKDQCTGSLLRFRL